MTTAGVLVLALAVPAVVLLGACTKSEPIPPAEPGGAQVQEVPQMADGSSSTVQTYCLAPAGSGLRVFVSRDGHGRAIQVPVNVTALPEGSPYRCP